MKAHGTGSSREKKTQEDPGEIYEQTSLCSFPLIRRSTKGGCPVLVFFNSKQRWRYVCSTSSAQESLLENQSSRLVLGADDISIAA